MIRIRSWLLLLVYTIAPLDATVLRLTVERREAPAYGGKVFGKAGQYELLSGHFRGELDPRGSFNQIINDIQLATKNDRGMVDYTGTFAIARPMDPAKASGVLLYSVANRGRGAPTPNEDGHISVVSGWQGDLQPAPGVQTLTVPAASGVTGPVTALFADAPAGARTLPLSSALSSIAYQWPASLDTTKARLTKRAKLDGPRTLVSPSDWAFADCSGGIPFPGKPDRTKICAKDGFDPAMLYELVYTSQDPLVLGIGYAATRDLISFLRRKQSLEANPLAGTVQFAIAEGNSQSGNYLRSFVHLGFNRDESGRIVFDGMNPHIAARQLAMNFRFAVAGGIARLYEPGSDGVVWWSKHRGAGLLDRCTATGTCPKIVETFGGLEFWVLRMSPDLVGKDAKEDIPLPANVRRYYFPATTHGGGGGGFRVEAGTVPAGCVLPANPNPESDTLRALRAALVEWVTKGTEPPPSRYPKLHPAQGEAGQLVAANAKAMGFPAIPGAPQPDGALNPVYDYDFGRTFRYADLSGSISVAPPVIRKTLPTLVPKTDADGNDLGGVPSVLLQAPLGTYTDWNLTGQGFFAGQWCGLNGGYIPFAKTKAEREASGDPRLSLEERYGTHERYVELVKAAADRAVAERFLLPQDAKRLVREAAASAVLVR